MPAVRFGRLIAEAVLEPSGPSQGQECRDDASFPPGGVSTVKQYLYAIVDRLPARWRSPSAGLAGGPVVPCRVGGLVLLSSLLDSVPPANPRTLALHQDVVATVVDAGATLPFRYGVAVPEVEVQEWLIGRRARVIAALGAVRGCVEMTVKLLRLEGALVHQLVGSRPGSKPAERDLQALAEVLAERAELPQWRYHPASRAGNVAAAVAFLVPRSDLAGFLARIAPVASHAGGVAVVPTGPWAPYSFVPELGDAASGRMPAEAFDGLGRRAG